MGVLKYAVVILLIAIEGCICLGVRELFKNSRIVPDSIERAPKKSVFIILAVMRLIVLVVKFPNGAEAKLGNELLPAQTVNEPEVGWVVSPDTLYTLVMVDVDRLLSHPGSAVFDGQRLRSMWTPASPEYSRPWVLKYPDAPSRNNPLRRHWLHWLVGNIPGQKIGKGDKLASYNGPTPPKGTGPHRYVILVYKQDGELNFNEYWKDSDGSKRGNFDVAGFTAKYKLGNPIAGNFFTSVNP